MYKVEKRENAVKNYMGVDSRYSYDYLLNKPVQMIVSDSGRGSHINQRLFGLNVANIKSKKIIMNQESLDIVPRDWQDRSSLGVLQAVWNDAPSNVNKAIYEQADITTTAGGSGFASSRAEVQTTHAGYNDGGTDPGVDPHGSSWMSYAYAYIDMAVNGGGRQTQDENGTAKGTAGFGAHKPTRVYLYINYDTGSGNRNIRMHIIHHKIGRNTNNNADNLAWGTTAFNALGANSCYNRVERHREAFLNGGKWLATPNRLNNIYNSTSYVYSDGSDWYTPVTGILPSVKVPTSNLAAIQTIHADLNTTNPIYRLTNAASARALSERSTPEYNTGGNYGNTIRTAIDNSYAARNLPYELNETVSVADQTDIGLMEGELQGSIATSWRYDWVEWTMAYTDAVAAGGGAKRALPNVVEWNQNADYRIIPTPTDTGVVAYCDYWEAPTTAGVFATDKAKTPLDIQHY